MITLPLRCTHGYPRYPLSGIAAWVPHLHPAVKEAAVRTATSTPLSTCRAAATDNFPDRQFDYRGHGRKVDLGTKCHYCMFDKVSASALIV